MVIIEQRLSAHVLSPDLRYYHLKHSIIDQTVAHNDEHMFLHMSPQRPFVHS